MRIEPVSDGATIRFAETAAALEQQQIELRHPDVWRTNCLHRLLPPHWLVDLFMDAAQRGFAVPTHALFGRKSGNSEITRENTSVTYVFATTNFYGAAKRIRSPDPRIVLVQKWLQWDQRARTSAARICLKLQVKTGAAKRIRTPDPRITNALLYQLSYCGVQP
jgi:hypothetical protein